MNTRLGVEIVVASFDDPILTGLRVEQDAESAARFGAAGGSPAADTGIVFVVARQSRALIGCAGMRRLGNDAAEVRRLYVRPEYRGVGVARLLLAGVEDLARRRGFAVTRLGVADPAETELYESNGYMRIAPYGTHPARSFCFEKSLRAEVPRQGAG
jgi:GNAT superfamily N-acetyltransferase